MKDDIIKNPNRNKQQNFNKIEPEYVRLGITPKQYISAGATENFVPNPSKKRGQNLVEVEENVIMSADDEYLQHYGTGQIIDNNDYIDIPGMSGPLPQIKIKPSENNDEIKKTAASDYPEVGNYILMVFGKLVASGSLSEIEEKVKNIIYGDDKEFKDLSVDDIIVLKRIDIKIGVFIDG